MNNVSGTIESTGGAPGKSSVLGRLSKLFAGSGDARSEATLQKSDLIKRLEQLTTERDRLRDLIAAENERVSTLGEQLRDKEVARINALADARLNGSEPDRQRAESLLVDATVARRQIEESSAVAGRLRERLDALNAELETLRAAYRRELAAFLEALYASAMEKYNAVAPEVAQTVIEVAAIRRVMMACRLGNTNCGWDGAILLPGMRPGEGRHVPPILDGGGAVYAAAADARAGAVAQVLREAGFVYGLEKSNHKEG